MKLIKLECPNCKAKLEGSSDLKQFTCNYCGTTTILDEEKITVNNVSSKLKNALEDLQDYYENGNYNATNELAISLMKEYPNNKEIQRYYINSIIKKIENSNDTMQNFIDIQSLYNEYKDNNKVQELYKKITIELYKEFKNITNTSMKLLYFEEIPALRELLTVFPNDSGLKQLHAELKRPIIEFINSNMEKQEFKSDLNYLEPKDFKKIINEVYPNDRDMEELCNKYADTYQKTETLEESIETQKKNNKYQNFILTIVLVDIPAILLLPFIMLLVHYRGSSPYLIASIITGIVLIIGINCKRNSCKECGKFNAYKVVDEEVLDSWVTTESRDEYNNRTNTTRKVYVTVTKEKVRLKKRCSNCADVQYEVIIRTR